VLPSFAGGGAERVVLNLLRLLDRSRFRPVLIVLDASGPLHTLVPDDVEVHALDCARMRAALKSLVTCIRGVHPAVVFSTFTHMNLPLLSARALLGGARIMVREANLPSLSLRRLPIPWAVRAGCRVLYPRADAMLASSRRMRDELLGYGVLASRLHCLRNPVDVERLRRNMGPMQRAPGPGQRFVAVGRLVPQKGFDRLISDLARGPPDWHCDVLGEGPERVALEALARRLGARSRVTFHGFVANPAPRIAGADACLVPSRFEGMPNVALEALALGTPVIATPEAGGARELPDVTSAGAGAAFIAAMQAVTVRPLVPHDWPRPSLLPADFAFEQVGARFNTLLEQTIADGA